MGWEGKMAEKTTLNDGLSRIKQELEMLENVSFDVLIIVLRAYEIGYTDGILHTRRDGE